MSTYIWLGVGVLVILAIGAAFLYGRRSGRDSQRVGDLSATNKVKNVQLDKANQRRDPGAVADRLRKHDF